MTTIDDIHKLVARLREAYDNGDDTEIGAAIEAIEVALAHVDAESLAVEVPAEPEPEPKP